MRAEAARDLTTESGPEVTPALIAALDDEDTAVTDAATEALLRRADLGALEPMWCALRTLDRDVTDQMWSVIRDADFHESPLAKELIKRSAEASP